MADTMNKQNDSMNSRQSDSQMGGHNKQNPTAQHEQVNAGERQSQQGGTEKNRQSEQTGMDKNRQEKSAIGGGENRSQSGNQTGEPGRARDELDQGSSQQR